ncbi:MAG TPA: hypothetical protein VFI02_03735 [Armatimonadota bacterium]|nr:hypothetical protein [Armatimonadota bacterium]
MNKFLKWVPWKTVILGEVIFALILLFVVKGRVLWTDWPVGIIMCFLAICGITWAVRTFEDVRL